MPGQSCLWETLGSEPAVGRAGGGDGPAGKQSSGTPEPQVVPEWVAKEGEPVLSRRLSRVGALSSRHKSLSNRRRISLGMGRCSGGRARALGGSSTRGRAVYPSRRPQPPRGLLRSYFGVAPPIALWLLRVEQT